MEKLSVVVPVYNTYPYLRECLDSIINQTYKYIEIIIVNDASPYEEDDIICREYTSKDNRIVYIKHTENKFQGGARNTGINAATGKYITFIDSDDFLINNNIYMKIMNEWKKNEKINVIGFNTQYYFHQINEYRDVEYMHINNKYTRAGKMSIYSCTDIVWHKVYKLDDIKDKELYFKSNFLYEDTDFTIRYIAKIKPIYKFLDIKAYAYRQRQNSVSHTQDSAKNKIKSLYSTYTDLLQYGVAKEYSKYFFAFIEKYYEEIKKDDCSGYCKELDELTYLVLNNMDEYSISINQILSFIIDDKIREFYQNIIKRNKPFQYRFLYKLKRKIKRIFSN